MQPPVHRVAPLERHGQRTWLPLLPAPLLQLFVPTAHWQCQMENSRKRRIFNSYNSVIGDGKLFPGLTYGGACVGKPAGVYWLVLSEVIGTCGGIACIFCG